MAEKKEGAKAELKGIGKTAILVVVALLVMFSMGMMYYIIKWADFNTGSDAGATYSGTVTLDPTRGIQSTIVNATEQEDEDGSTSVISIEELFEGINNANTYLKDDEESTKYEKLQYLMNAEIVSKYPYISSLEDEDALNGTIKFYRYTNQAEAEDEKKF